jgi:predicted short-subunit dehydrogenase-like oxidoreductase (DUF2520 family)
VTRDNQPFDRVRVLGRGRAGSVIAARLIQAGISVLDEPATTAAPADDRGLVLLAVPDAAIAAVAATIPAGPWIAHVSGATGLDALAPHARRFSVHPLQTLVSWRGPEQLEGAAAAVTAETSDGRVRAHWLARTLGLAPFELADAMRPLYHAGAAMASNYLVTLYRTAAALVEAAGAPSDVLLPLVRRTVDNGFELTGPIARGDWSTVGRHLDALGRHRPDLLPLYRALADATRP